MLCEQVARESLIHRQCYHIKDHGGLKQAVRDTKAALTDYRFVFKSDIKGYYASIDHDVLCDDVKRLTGNKEFTRLLRSSLEAPSTWGGLYYDHKQGIARGSPLSPLLGAIALNPLDRAITEIKGVFYARYMDDWVVLCKTRHQLRNVIKRTYQVLEKLKLKIHPDKTYIGKIEKGFDFLGYHFKPNTLRVATVTLERALTKLRQLYEQGATINRLAQYWKRFLQGVKGGIKELLDDGHGISGQHGVATHVVASRVVGCGITHALLGLILQPSRRVAPYPYA